ncbi:restriction endonuclease subunit S [Helicobacter pylori]|uniref:restriction endonuclease subunit S n=1 Tax=Helicobacter pylori TaxID=210 RepID=UPI000FDDB497|nr:restriction endonuclease subunit S [Helicobacter pylori]RVZ79247.1 restriction endonuclease subunit S [Helicobacter pylori]
MDALTTPLPKDWEVKTFRDISTINQGLQIPISQRLKVPTEHAKFYITIQALNNRKEFEYIKTYNESVVCHKDDILMTRTGNTGMVITNIEGVFHNNFFKINFDRTLINKDFLVYFLSLEQTQKTILRKAGTSTIPDLNHNDFYSLSIPLPPLNEQIAIANILSALDRYLYSLDALILKKESVKKALSFELLSQRKRLKGFNQAWQRVRLGDIAEIKRGVRITKNELDVFGKYPVVSGGVGFLGYTNNFNRYENTITIAQYGTAGFVNWQNQKFWANDVCFCVYPNKDVIKNIFLYYFLKVNQNYLYEISNRNATPYSISKDKILDFEIPLPPLNEQIAIANILSTLDNEITSLKNKKRQFENIKKALNHDLMSAKIRVLKK